MNDPVIVDTDILIDVGRDVSEAVACFQQIEQRSSPAISVITQMELMDGYAPPQDNTEREMQATKLGELMARLHRHGAQWKLPQGFVRPRYDWGHFHASLMLLQPAVHDGLIAVEDFATLEAGIQRLQRVMSALGETPDSWGLIHSVLHETNYLFYGDEARPIGFAFCGFGHFIFDIAFTFRHLNHDARLKRAFISGYQSVRKLPDDWQSIAEAFWVGGIARDTAYHSPDPRERQGIVTGVPRFVKAEGKRFLRGEPFLFETSGKFWKGLM